MKHFKVLGSGCRNCKNTVALLEKAANELDSEISVEKVEQPAQIMAYGVMSTPAVVLDEQVIHKGSVPSYQQVLEWLQ
ncbi:MULTISPECIES: thioredoxin family protein [unclassified Agarivorans]|uniref:thioredoxin family protein n=1 Tax=unclassified Agarivorans TaxID=2636026 RepID=UPI003D7C49C3